MATDAARGKRVGPAPSRESRGACVATFGFIGHLPGQVEARTPLVGCGLWDRLGQVVNRYYIRCFKLGQAAGPGLARRAQETHGLMTACQSTSTGEFP
jgi:hypothetical protein